MAGIFEFGSGPLVFWIKGGPSSQTEGVGFLEIDMLQEPSELLFYKIAFLLNCLVLPLTLLLLYKSKQRRLSRFYVDSMRFVYAIGLGLVVAWAVLAGFSDFVLIPSQFRSDPPFALIEYVLAGLVVAVVPLIGFILWSSPRDYFEHEWMRLSGTFGT